MKYERLILLHIDLLCLFFFIFLSFFYLIHLFIYLFIFAYNVDLDRFLYKGLLLEGLQD